jgi:hypothetical protein
MTGVFDLIACLWPCLAHGDYRRGPLMEDDPLVAAALAAHEVVSSAAGWLSGLSLESVMTWLGAHPGLAIVALVATYLVESAVRPGR